jgi:RHS repeat-associated protein
VGTFQGVSNTGLGQPTALTAKLSFSGHFVSVTANGATPTILDPAIAESFTVTPSTPIKVLPVGCWTFPQAPPTGTRVRLLALTPAGMSLFSALGGTLAKLGVELENQRLLSDPVNTATGSFVHEVSDVGVPGVGVPFVFSRAYDSRSTVSGPLGAVWGSTLFESMVLNATTGAVTWKSGTGTEIEFASNGAGGYISRTGVVGSVLAVVGGGWELLRSGQDRSRFNAAGKVVSRLDRSGKGLTFAYNAAGQLATVTDAAARVHTFTYGTVAPEIGLLKQVKTSDARTVKFAYTALAGASRLTTFTDERATNTTYVYNAAGLLESEKDQALKAQFTNTYDSLGRVLTQLDQLNNLSTFVWDDVAGKVTFTDAALAVHVDTYANFALTGSSEPSGASATTYDDGLNPSSFTDASLRTWTATWDTKGNMLSRTSPAPFSYLETWTYDSFNNPLTYKDGRNTVTTYTYDTVGRVKSVSTPSPGGAVVQLYNWNPDGTLLNSTDPRGGVTQYTYTVNGLVASITTPLGFKTTYGYDTAGRVNLITEPRGNVAGAVVANFQEKFTYDADGNLLTYKDALNRLTTHTYDNIGLRRTTLAPDTRLTKFDFNDAHELVLVTAADLGTTQYLYDNRGLVSQMIAPTGAVTKYTYDADGRLMTRTDPREFAAGSSPNDFTWSYTYDPVGRVKSVSEPRGFPTTYDYDELGRLTSTARLSNFRRQQTYDANNNVLTRIEDDTWTTSQTYDSINRVDTSTDARGKITSYGYDLGGNLTSVTDPLQRVTRYSFDADGRMDKMIDPRGSVVGANPVDFTTTYKYDEANHPIETIDPNLLSTKSTYDRVGNVATSTNARNLVTTYGYDPMNRIKTIAPAGIGTTTYTYTPMGYMDSRTDPLSTATVPRVSRWVYDQGGRVKEKKDALGRKFTYDYDVANNLTQIVDANANTAANPALGTTTMQYDRLNRLVQTAYSDGTPTVTQSYSPQNQLFQIDDATGTTVYSYFPKNRLYSVKLRTTSTTVPEREIDYAYNQNGQVTSRSVGKPTGPTTTFDPQYSYVYDDAGQLSSVNNYTVADYSFEYDPAGNPTKTVFPGGVVQTRTYDKGSRLSAVTNTVGAVPVSSFTYGRDANGNPTTMTVGGPAGVVATESTLNVFDSFDRLTQSCITVTTACVAATTSKWTYNAVGNRLTEKIGSAAVSTYTYDVADQLSSVVGPGAAAFTYNPNGDQLTAGVDVFAYNTARQVKSATVGGVASTFTYDGRGARYSRTTAGLVTKSTVDPVFPMGNVIDETTFNANGTVNSSQEYAYTPGGGLLGYRGATGTQPAVYGSFLTDGLGSVTEITTATGTVGASYRYNQYGTARPATSIQAAYAGNTMRFTGQQLDPTGTYNLRARQYNPVQGRFTQTDPMPYGAGSSFESSYVYGQNNPGLMTDPSGLRSQKCRGALMQEAYNGLNKNGWGFGDNFIFGMQSLVVNTGSVLTGGYSNAMCASAEGNYKQAAGDFVGQQANNASYAGAVNGGAGMLGMTAKQAAVRCAAGAAGSAAIEGAVSGKVTAKGTVLGCLNAGNIKATKPAGALVEEGTYVVKTAQGEYVGQSGAISRRLQQHVASGKFTQAEVNAAERAMVTGGKLQREIAEQLLIDSKGGIDGLLNKVNPIGPKRVSVMPNQPYKR